MAAEQFIDQKLELVFNPLTITHGLEVLGNVTSEQTYDMATNMYVPNFALTFLVIQPWMNIVDPDGVIADGAVAIADPTWTEIKDGKETLITNGDKYSVDADGALSVKYNLTPNTKIAVRFEGKYQDPRTGDVFTMIETHPIMCQGVSQAPKLTLDFPQLSLFDPISADKYDVTVHAYFKIGENDVPAANRKLVWEKRDLGDADFAEIDPNDPLDYDVVVAADGMSAVVKRDLIGHRIDLRVRAKYDPYGNPASIALNDRSPKAEMAFVRKLPVPTPVALAARKFRPGLSAFKPEGRLYVGNKEITDPEKWYDLSWYMSQGNAAGTVARTLIASGAKPTIPTQKVVKTYGATVTLGVKEKRPPSAIKLADGSILVDGNGNTIIA